MKNKKKVEIWSDFACPFCWIGEKRLADALRELDAEDDFEITYRAFELNPDAPVKHPEGASTAERLAAKYGITLEEAKKRIAAIERMASDLGLDMKFANVKQCNTFDAHRLMKFAEDQYEAPVAEGLNNLLFKAYFSENKCLSDRKLLLKLAEEVAMDPTQCNEVLERGYYADQVRFDEREAAERGVHGVPYILFEGQYAIPGAVSTDDFKTVIRELLGREKGSPNGLHGGTCDENGCRL